MQSCTQDTICEPRRVRNIYRKNARYFRKTRIGKHTRHFHPGPDIIFEAI